MQEQINQAQQKLKNLIQQRENTEAVLLQYQSGIINSHTLFENYHNLTIYINELNRYVKDFKDEFDRSRTGGASKDALYFQGRRLNEQILAQLTKVHDLSNRVKIELNNAQSKPNQSQTNNWETFNDNYQDDPLVDINTDKSRLQLQHEDDTEAVQAQHDMQKLETDIVKINEMFTTIAGFVHEQGDIADRIEASVEVAYSQIDSANDQLSKAVDHKRSARKKKIFCVIILLAVILIIGLIIWLSLRN